MEFTPINTQEELNRVIAERIARERNKAENDMNELRLKYADYDEIKSGHELLKSRIAELEANTTALNQQIESANGKVAKYERESVKIKVAEANGLDYKFASYLQGETDEELTESAKFLAEHIKSKGVLPNKKSEPTPEDNSYKKLLNNMKGVD